MTTIKTTIKRNCFCYYGNMPLKKKTKKAGGGKKKKKKGR